ncbi:MULTISPECIES: TetR family transcriptional regulator [Enterobacter]|uniref:TetR family transcriptional regulator n=2 Tax=Enterobacter TaxID=547 RepID=A0ABU9PH07_9ENTR|nr:TetR family transcriptional regulator [Enterobacter genomosp. S]KZR31411.1 hypothetical protein A3466_02560 [Enterobacter genomosp. S]
MARKKKEEAQKTRQQLIEAAIGLFATRGVANTTLTDIADAAQLTRGAVYWHFSSKAEIFNAISSQTNIELAVIAFHAIFSGVIKNWLMHSNSFNLYQQAPALVDNILATLHITRVTPVVYDTAS